MQIVFVMGSSSAHSGSQAYGLHYSLKSVVWIAGVEQIKQTANANLACIFGTGVCHVGWWVF